MNPYVVITVLVFRCSFAFHAVASSETLPLQSLVSAAVVACLGILGFGGQIMAGGDAGLGVASSGSVQRP